MKKAHKQAILEYISENDPNGELIEKIEPTDEFRGGQIKYNENAVKLNRSISTLGSEEYVRAYLFVRLCTKLGYESGPDKIEFEKEYSIGRPSTKKARVDILVRYPNDWAEEDKQGGAFLFIECKAPEKYEDDRDYLEGQVFKLAKQEDPRPENGVYYTTRLESNQVLDRALIVDLKEHRTFNEWDEEGQPSNDILPSEYGKPSRVRYAKVEETTEEKRPLREDGLSPVSCVISNWA